LPAKTVKQKRLMAIAESHPEKVYKRNKGVLGMTKSQMHEYASTKEKGLPMKKSASKKKGK